MLEDLRREVGGITGNDGEWQDISPSPLAFAPTHRHRRTADCWRWAGPNDRRSTDQFAILKEILRLEPVASLVHRRVVENIETGAGSLQQGEVACVSIRDANVDEASTGPCPFELDPDRARRMKVAGSYMSFSDGPHRCPGAQVALHETRIFLDRMFRLPGIRMEKEPEIQWNTHIQGYELRGCIVACDPA